MKLKLTLLPERFTICRLPADAEAEPPASDGRFRSVTRTAHELSLVLPEDEAPEAGDLEGPFSCFEVDGPLSFSMTGVFASLTAPLAEAEIPVFTISTYNTDYLFVRDTALEKTRHVLEGRGHSVAGPDDESAADGEG